MLETLVATGTFLAQALILSSGALVITAFIVTRGKFNIIRWGLKDDQPYQAGLDAGVSLFALKLFRWCCKLFSILVFATALVWLGVAISLA